jgi:site-specific DNA-methyltransferase (adenine-specific)
MYEIINSECLEYMRTMESNSVDAIVTDPPAGISFMNSDWDHHRGGRDEWIKWMQGISEECFRVLKHGGHALVWALPRTSHWTGYAWQDAGFEPRDKVYHVFSSGFPKSASVSKHIDRMLGAEREIVGKVKLTGTARKSTTHTGHGAGATNAADPRNYVETYKYITVPATEAAKKWDGWGTALKPSVEEWWLLRKPIIESSVAKNMMVWHTGAINIDGCRVEAEAGEAARFPAQLVHDGSEEVLELFGEAARFFYCSKASRSDRGKGNSHPSVKATELMLYLCRLITPPEGIVLDPFMGSGSTGKAALLEGFHFIGIEQNTEYFNIAQQRLSNTYRSTIGE